MGVQSVMAHQCGGTTVIAATIRMDIVIAVVAMPLDTDNALAIPSVDLRMPCFFSAAGSLFFEKNY